MLPKCHMHAAHGRYARLCVDQASEACDARDRRAGNAPRPTSEGKTMAILQDMTSESTDLQAIIAKLKAENEALRKATKAKVTLKVTDKGGVSMYGLGRFPVSLYRGQWERLLGAKEDILAFIEANADQLSVKE